MEEVVSPRVRSLRRNHRIVVWLLAASPLLFSSLPKDARASSPEETAAGFGPGCTQREYIYVGSRLLAAVRVGLESVSVGFSATGATTPESGVVAATVALHTPSSLGCSVTVAFATVDGTATVQDQDYIPKTGVVTFPVGSAEGAVQSISIDIAPDNRYETNETFFIQLSNAAGATLAGSTFVATILNNDPLPAISMSDVSLLEGTSGTTNASFELKLSNESGMPVSVSYATSDGTATTPTDYEARTGSVSFDPHVVSQIVRIPVVADTRYEGDEYFTLNLSNVAGGTIANSQARASIVDDDPPALSINDVRGPEGNAGQSRFTFTVSLEGPSHQTIDVDYQTEDCTATAASADYVAASGHLTLPSNSGSAQSFNVLVNGGSAPEGAEIFKVRLLNPVNAVLGRAIGQGSIENDDGALPHGLPWVDFDGDGRADLLLQHRSSGKVVAWLMNGVNRVDGTFLTPDQPADFNWRAVATLDFDGDGKTDVLFRNETSGKLVAWLMNGLIRQGGLFLTPDAGTNPTERVVATGDFNRDGHTDLLWRDDSNGTLEVWLMNGTNRIDSPLPTSPPQSADLNWKVVGAGDFDGDGTTDIAWQNSISGRISFWFMDGVTRRGGGFATPAGPDDPAYRVISTVDLDGDGHPDLLFRHASSGRFLFWPMNGISRICEATLSPEVLPDLNWQIAGAR